MMDVDIGRLRFGRKRFYIVCKEDGCHTKFNHFEPTLLAQHMMDWHDVQEKVAYRYAVETPLMAEYCFVEK